VVATLNPSLNPKRGNQGGRRNNDGINLSEKPPPFGD
jgi:hypothetical protein